MAEAEIARCQYCQSSEIFPIDVYGQETKFWCGNCSNNVELKPGTVLRKLPRAAWTKPRHSLNVSPMEQFMMTRRMSERAEDLLALRQELLDTAEDE